MNASIDAKYCSQQLLWQVQYWLDPLWLKADQLESHPSWFPIQQEAHQMPLRAS